MKKPLLYAFQKAEGVHKIYIYDEIAKYGQFNWETWEYDESETSAKHFLELLDTIPEADKIELHFNSNGGAVDQGTAIYNMLQAHKSYKTGIVDGACHSIAFTILQACDKRIMNQGTTAIIHDMWASVVGNARDLRQAADNLDVAMEACIALFMQRATIPEDTLRELMHKETTLSPQLALEYGLIDEIGQVEVKADPDQMLQMLQKENAELRQKIKGRSEAQEQLAKFFELTRRTKEEPKDEPRKQSIGFDAFFND